MFSGLELSGVNRVQAVSNSRNRLFTADNNVCISANWLPFVVVGDALFAVELVVLFVVFVLVVGVVVGEVLLDSSPVGLVLVISGQSAKHLKTSPTVLRNSLTALSAEWTGSKFGFSFIGRPVFPTFVGLRVEDNLKNSNKCQNFQSFIKDVTF